MYRFETFRMPDEIHTVTEPADRQAVDILNLCRTELLGRQPTRDLDELNDIRDDLFTHNRTYITTNETALVGFATFDPMKSHLENIAVKPHSRERGVGKFIVANLVQQARDIEREHIQLRSVLSAVGFYRKLGFIEVDPDPKRHIMPLMRLDISDDCALRTAGLLPISQKPD